MYWSFYFIRHKLKRWFIDGDLAAVAVDGALVVADVPAVVDVAAQARTDVRVAADVADREEDVGDRVDDRAEAADALAADVLAAVHEAVRAVVVVTRTDTEGETINALRPLYCTVYSIL